MGIRKPIGQILIEKGYINEAQLEQAVFKQHIYQNKIGRTLVELGHITEEQLKEGLVAQQSQASKST